MQNFSTVNTMLLTNKQNLTSVLFLSHVKKKGILTQKNVNKRLTIYFFLIQRSPQVFTV